MYLKNLLSFVYWDPDPEVFILPFVHWPVLWYGVFFALGFGVSFFIFQSLLIRFFLLKKKFSEEPFQILKKNAAWISDRLTMYVTLGTIIGARLGHFLFYESPSHYLAHPLELLWIRKGGLASHGAAIGIVFAVLLFTRRYRQKCLVSCLRLLDFICIPTALAGFAIRVGNFFNQEILGTCTRVPWAVIFGHPMDHSAPTPRHPVQLYEAGLYLAVFFLLWRLSFLPPYFRVQGRLLSLFLILVFSGRFFIEFFKVEQSVFFSGFFITMGQLLSIAPIFIGIFLWKWAKKRKSLESCFEGVAQ